MSDRILVIDLIRGAISQMVLSGNQDAEIDAWLLAEDVFDINRQKYFMNPNICAGEQQAKIYEDKVELRCNKIPLQHITGKQEFMGFTFKVNENVLIPRQDTELLVEKVIKQINSCENIADKSMIKVLDMCTGSGCIAVSINKLTGCKVTAVDLSTQALEVAKKNAKELDAEVEFIHSDLFDKISYKYDIIVSNPPYISNSDILELMEEVKNHEPMMALDGDDDGLKFYRLISHKANEYLAKDGMIFYEIGYDQGVSVPQILEKNNFKDINVFKDLSENDRVVTARKGE